MSKYKIIWFPTVRWFIEFLKEDNTEYWSRTVMPGIKNIDLIPLHGIAHLLLAILFPFIIIRGEI